MVFNFVQFAGAVPFSSLLGGKKRSNKRSNNKRSNSNKRSNRKKRSNSNRRTNRKTNNNKRSNRRTNRRTNNKTNKRNTRKRVNKRTQKRVEKRTQKRIKIKKSDCKCPKKKNLDSPDGLGICAQCEPEGIVMKGKDGQLWVSKGDHWQLERQDMS